MAVTLFFLAGFAVGAVGTWSILRSTTQEMLNNQAEQRTKDTKELLRKLEIIEAQARDDARLEVEKAMRSM